MRIPKALSAFARCAALLSSAAFLLDVPVAWGQSPRTQHGRSFTGFYVGVDGGWQNIIGGSVVSGVDVLRQDRRPVVSVSVGLRLQAPFGTVVGADLGRGRIDGNLLLNDPAVPLTVRYGNRAQGHWTLTLGQAIGSAHASMAYIYVSEVSRVFEVQIEEGTRRSSQRDEQGLLRYGVGLEQTLSSHFSIRGAVGTSRADFGKQALNITPRRLVDVSLGGVARLGWQRRR